MHVVCLTGANLYTRHHWNVVLTQVSLARSLLQSCGSHELALVPKFLELRRHSDYCIGHGEMAQCALTVQTW